MATSDTAKRAVPAKQMALVRDARQVGDETKISQVTGGASAYQRMYAKRLVALVDEIVDAGHGEGPF